MKVESLPREPVYNPPFTSVRDIAIHGLTLLIKHLNTHRVIAFTGSGVSQAYGYPTWQDLALHVVESAKNEHPGKEVLEL